TSVVLPRGSPPSSTSSRPRIRVGTLGIGRLLTSILDTLSIDSHWQPRHANICAMGADSKKKRHERIPVRDSNMPGYSWTGPPQQRLAILLVFRLRHLVALHNAFYVAARWITTNKCVNMGNMLAIGPSESMMSSSE